MDFLNKPSTDFAAVRDGRNSLPLWMDIDLTTARSIGGTGANAALSINIAGNSFYVDQDTANVGNATVHFQDTNLGASSAPLFVSAGFIANVPFTQILIENTAQAGKRLRIFYGVDIDFQAGINASIAISGAVQVNNTLDQKIPMYESGIDYGASFKSSTLLAANTPETIFTPAANVNGAIVWTASAFSLSGGVTHAAFVAKNSAPATTIDGDVLSEHVAFVNTNHYACKISRAIKIGPGKGLYYIPGYAETTTAIRMALYTLL